MNWLKEQFKKIISKLALVKRQRWILMSSVAFPAIIIFMFVQGISGKPELSEKNPEIYQVSRGSLPITLTESGDVKALNSVDIKSEVEGRTTIVYIVDEGTYITPEDVNNGKIIVELDSSQIKQSLTQQEITVLAAEASYTQAKEGLEIQMKQNDSDIKAAQMKARFALIDMQKYIGETLANKMVADLKTKGEPSSFAWIIDDNDLGGEALQKVRELESDIYMKMQRLEVAKNDFEWSEKLCEKEYISKQKKESDRLTKEQSEIECKKAITAKDLFSKYEFPKQVEKLLSDFSEALRALERAEATARAKLAQSQAQRSSNEATYRVQKERLEKLQRQLAACKIKAPTAGQIVYWSSTERYSRVKIEVGADIGERHRILTIPDPREMKVVIKVHETWVDKVEIGQSAKITLAAFPDKVFTGKVLKKAPLTDQQDSWLNPDLKVYATEVSIEGIHNFRTNMTAKVEIMIEELPNIISVPVQSVVNREGKKVCYILKNNGPEPCGVETGAFNASFVEIKSGLNEGDKVMLNPPRITEKPANNKPKTNEV